ncbi:hypothetical protein C8A05DRAFT_34963 [Staphylotrichum tortipilum]|uniref:Uncharacterized protein n=1 Tax=Staphylotrichum tortipilum TaxID=2831512 RepID=A0AAN6MIT8_9PEZI|nr:hypothetical protein C8A05DRAFT_34963 [Staphylotrichum longicolle]
MKTIIAILVTMAGLAWGAPNPDSLLSTRQSCVYLCGCQTDGNGGVDPDTALCCASVGGVLENEDTLCGQMDLTKAQAYATCCGDSGGYVCFQDRGCPPVVIN